MFTAMQNVVPSHLCDNDLFDFKAIDADSGIINGGDIGFDQPLITPSSATLSANTIKNNLDTAIITTTDASAIVSPSKEPTLATMNNEH
jgi:hypothetical protein